MEEFSQNVIKIIKNIPIGKILTYKAVAALAGSPLAARQVVRLLHTQTEKFNLPWQRVINSQGRIGLKKQDAYLEQKVLLVTEGIKFNTDDSIDLDKYLWPIKSLKEI